MSEKALSLFETQGESLLETNRSFDILKLAFRQFRPSFGIFSPDGTVTIGPTKNCNYPIR